MNRWSLLWAVTVLAVLFGGPTGAAGRRLDADTAWPAAAGVEPVSLSVLPELQPATAEVQNAPLLQAAAPARANTLSSMSFGKGPTAAPPREADATRTFSRIVTQLPAGSSLMTAGDLEAQFTGPKRPQVFGGRSTDFKAQANGVGGIPYSDSRFTADYYTLGKTRVGKLYMSFGRRWWVCSASVINRALLVTAAHCVCEWGQGQNCFPDKDADDNLLVYFDLGRDVSPGQDRWTPEKWWPAQGIILPSSYAFGTDSNLASGIVTNNDLALVWLKPLNGTEVGDVGGWFSYAVNGWGFSAPSVAMGLGAPTAPASAMLTNLAYPVAFDRGDRMQISQSATYFMQLGGVKRNPRGVKGLVRGTSFTPGSSGSAWVANYGIDAEIRSNDNGPLGQYGPFNAERNVVLGLMSWGYEDPGLPGAKQIVGSSMFGTNREFPADTYGIRGPGNIGALMDAACDNPALSEWQLWSKGLCLRPGE